MVWECMQVLEKVPASNTVTLVWIPEHHGIPGNEEADKLTKEGTKVSSNQTAWHSLCCGQRSHHKSLETGAPEQVEDLYRLLPTQEAHE